MPRVTATPVVGAPFTALIFGGDLRLSQTHITLLLVVDPLC